MRKLLICLLTITAVLSSCGEETSSTQENSDSKTTAKSKESKQNYKKSTFPVVGKIGMMAVVSNSDVWTPEVEQAIDSVFGEYFRPYYPPQKRFTSYHLTPRQFEKRNRRVRNLMFLEIDDKVKKGSPSVELKEDYYASTQMTTFIKAHDMADLIAACENDLWEIGAQYDKMSWRREVMRNQERPNKFVNGKIDEKFGIHLDFPKNASIVSSRKNFVRVAFPDESRPMDLSGGNYQTSKTNFIQYGVMIWQYTFNDSSQLAYQTMLNTRDTVLKYNVPHEFDGVYMGTQYHPAVIPIRKKLTLNTVEGYELTGLFKFTGESEPSGGMFWSFTFLHPKRQKVITLSGFVDVLPTTSAVPYIRRIQAILYSLRLDE